MELCEVAVKRVVEVSRPDAHGRRPAVSGGGRLRTAPARRWAEARLVMAEGGRGPLGGALGEWMGGETYYRRRIDGGRKRGCEPWRWGKVGIEGRWCV